MKRRVVVPLVLVSLLAGLAPAQAGSWLFRPSYYTHGAPGATPEAVASRRPVGGPFFTPPQGEFVRGSWRMSRTIINVGGKAFDQTIDWQAHIQGGSQW